MLELLRQALPDFRDISVSEIRDGGKIVGWESICYLKSGIPFSGGTSEDKMKSLRIAISEAFERALVTRIRSDQSSSREFLCSSFCDTSGFAAGFDRGSVKYRSLCEALERWARSVWIDKQLVLPRCDDVKLTPLAKHQSSFFSKVHFFKKKVFTINGNDLYYYLTLGKRERGIFAGSRVGIESHDNWTHSLVEAARNYSNSINFRVKSHSIEWLPRKLRYFSLHGDQTLNELLEHSNLEWPSPELLLQKEFVTNSPVILWRTLMKGYRPSSYLPIKRFVF